MSADAQTVQTVLGPVPAPELGRTLAHEHVFFDLRCYFTPSEDDPLGEMADAALAAERLWWIRTHPMNSRANLVQEDGGVAVEEVSLFKQAGGGTLVDVTTVGLAPKPQALADVSRETGVNIVAGTGFYIAGSYDNAVLDWDETRLADFFRRELLQGMGDTTIRAGLIGELGVSNPILDGERRTLRAAARVQRELGVAVSLHPSWGPEGALEAVRAAEEAGLEPGRTAISHLDNRFGADEALHLEVARRGFMVELDSFGREIYYPHVNAQLPSDAERIRALMALLERGFAGQILVAQDICFAHELVRNGGHGYAHFLRSVTPRLTRSGVADESIQSMLVENPRRWLAGT
ncbi:MAG TPA: hypothetical protein VFN74_18375 [Chloroflexota bacterium]|nr:hypothetical protein [Chloroflexota bacterium]